jgi:hypothetical protein
MPPEIKGLYSLSVAFFCGLLEACFHFCNNLTIIPELSSMNGILQWTKKMAVG